MSEKSSNAYKHGAQSEPQKSLTLVHLKYILGFEAEAMDLLYPTPRITAAMNLAACEARLDQVYTHYIKVQGRDRDPDFDRLMECAEDFLYFASPNAREVREALSRILKLEGLSTFSANHEKRLANRYLREAWSKRHSALRKYLEIEFAETEG